MSTLKFTHKYNSQKTENNSNVPQLIERQTAEYLWYRKLSKKNEQTTDKQSHEWTAKHYTTWKKPDTKLYIHVMPFIWYSKNGKTTIPQHISGC
jgi:hypothetical protein